MFENFSLADFSTGFIGGSLSVFLVALVGRYLASKFTPLENGKVVGFCLAAGLVLGRGTVVRGSPSPEEIALLGRAVGSLLVLGGIWFAWFKRGPKSGSERG